MFNATSDEARVKSRIFGESGALKRYQGLTFWTPNVNIFRDPRWGRGQETYGEDPYLTGQMGMAVVRGLQGPEDTKYDKLHACAKHFAVHSGPEWNRHSFDAENIDPRDLWETYLPAFKDLVQKAHVKEVMCAYNRFEGEPCCGSNCLHAENDNTKQTPIIGIQPLFIILYLLVMINLETKIAYFPIKQCFIGYKYIFVCYIDASQNE